MYVRPLLEYGTPVFGPTRVENIELLEKVQNNFTRELFLRSRKSGFRAVPSSSGRNTQLGLESLNFRKEEI